MNLTKTSLTKLKIIQLNFNLTLLIISNIITVFTAHFKIQQQFYELNDKSYIKFQNYQVKF